MSTEILPQLPLPQGKHVEHDPITSDFAAYYDGQLLGYRATRIAAQDLCNQYVWNLLTKGVAVPAGELENME